MKWQNGDKSDKMLPQLLKTIIFVISQQRELIPTDFHCQTKKNFMEASSAVFALSLLYLNSTMYTTPSSHYSVPMKKGKREDL